MCNASFVSSLICAEAFRQTVSSTSENTHIAAHCDEIETEAEETIYVVGICC